MANPENLADSLLPQINHNPDILSCLANLSNDEVFTPPPLANDMLDMLPQELFASPDTKFLDPVCKSGVFLREIVKRLMCGLEEKFPDQQKRLDHILHNQVYGIAITELTSLLSRRTLYCAKYATSRYAISKFANIEGNIRYKSIQHTWKMRILWSFSCSIRASWRAGNSCLRIYSYGQATGDFWEYEVRCYYR